MFSTANKNVALERGFYDLDPKIDLEGMIADDEARMRIGIYELINEMNPAALPEETRTIVSLFIALQFVRNKEFRAEIQEMGGKLMTELVRSHPKVKGLDLKIVMKDELALALQARTIVSYAVPRFASLLRSSLWTELLNRTKLPFWASDNPVALLNPKKKT
jgi:hypothetical protein